MDVVVVAAATIQAVDPAAAITAVVEAAQRHRAAADPAVATERVEHDPIRVVVIAAPANRHFASGCEATLR